jgi:hypothetical protein
MSKRRAKMSDEKEQGYTNIGTDGIQPIPVETKRERTELEKEVDQEIIAKGEKAVEDFDETQTITIPAKKKRGRPKKVVIREFYCATCREKYLETTVMKMPAGDNRAAIFCPSCSKSLGFFQPDVDEKIAKLHKNPSKK